MHGETSIIPTLPAALPDRVVGVTEFEAALLCHGGTSYGRKEEVALARYNGVEEFVRAHPQSHRHKPIAWTGMHI
jgi:hypothetical protein